MTKRFAYMDDLLYLCVGFQIRKENWIMNNVVIYDGFLGVFSFCRGGVDDKMLAVDPYGRMTDGRRDFHIANYGKELILTAEFFGCTMSELREKTREVPCRCIAGEGEYKIVFDYFGEPILYNAKDEDPKRIRKECRSNCGFFKEWGERNGFISKGETVTVYGWKFAKGVKYIRIRRYDVYSLLGLVPELFSIDGPYPFIKKEFKDGVYDYEAYQRMCQWLYGLDPIDLSKSYDYTDEEKAILAERKKVKEEAERKAAEELERRKNTPGFCNECGCEDAQYIPYLDRWLCRDCFFDYVNQCTW